MPEELTLDKCPLLKKYDPGGGQEVVTLYEDCRQMHAAIREQAPHVLGKLDCERVLRKAYQKLTRPRYQVGLLGFFQSGKSTTLNRLLGFENEDPKAPAKEGGAGRATTAVPTRVGYGEKAEAWSAWLEYLRASEIDRLIKGLCSRLQLEEVSNSRLVAIVQTDAEFNRPGARRYENLRYLHWLLKSLESGRSLLSSQDVVRRSEVIQYEQRFVLANHPAELAAGQLDDTTRKIPLLESVCLRLPVEGFPPELEIIDLPGMGSINPKDDFITESFVDEKDTQLDGALIFCEPDKLQTDDVVKFGQDLLREWKDLRGRAWMCFCKMDRVETNRLVRRDGDPSVLENMLAFLRRYGFPDDQAIFVSNKPQDIKPEARNPEAGLAELNCEAFRVAWTDLYPHGGIEQMRRIVYKQMPAQIGRGLVDEWKKKLLGLAADLASCGQCAVGAIKEPRAMKRANIALNRLTSAIAELQDSREFMRSGREVLQKELEVGLRELELEPEVLDRIGGLSKSFPQHARELQTKLQQQVFALLDDAFHLHRQLIIDAENSEPLVGLQIAPEGLLRAWDEFRLADRRRYSQVSDGSVFPSFVRDGPFDGLGPQDTPFSGAEYINLLTEKIGLTSRQAVQALQERLIEHLWQLVAGIKTFLEVDLSGQAAVQSDEFKRQIDSFHQKYGTDEKLT